jgi:hypothetical protein
VAHATRGDRGDCLENGGGGVLLKVLPMQG